ncbi:radical SAM family heme chaperone HemW [Crassaminicella profunda]|uniref:radical SAM family heme chaperone HemW n=1 Tax=Crassaminicella profunda TaxID=1286698 RepID=UPI001CA6325C|nr:radical SAM family heme chaperone HemW [Crassaminicella profunda]QZY56537.1 radical SAM family heme chaperone HemW [Crassaminicella profunda]
MREIGLYIHIPFCKQKCFYCDFCSFSNREKEISEYMDALREEMKSWEEKLKGCKIKSIFIGGGTPSIIPIKEMDKILETIHSNFHINKKLEFSIESNPGTINKDNLNYYLKNNINRLSMGLQAWQNDHLKSLGRIHNKEEFLKNFLLAREIGFENINIDLMFGLPNQTLNQWEETLYNVIQLNPEHISSYSLKIEENTEFYRLYEKGILKLPSEELDRRMYHFAMDYLLDYGYKHYEISNFAKEEKECIHNKIYWNNEEYIGFGLGAHSYFNKNRFSNTMIMEKYINNIHKKLSPCEGKESISRKDEIAETMFLGLRMMRGINIKEFKERFGCTPFKIYSEEILKFKKLGLLSTDDQYIRLTRRGIDLSNQVFVSFLPD